ncbi:hypothetical protein CUMW_219200 [Citrus unshiu]|uniref:non-specific serine/threonine protein kinase n=1 Tax=Citrus unshiu TaxID=55188 RepID=A0A2H5QDA1_CITUN|nr:hypothetical protein CUMW_219200 [Citrus unshiu]
MQQKIFIPKYHIETRCYDSDYRAKLPNIKALLLFAVQHQNIVKLYGFCLYKKCMFAIYKYMERGSLCCVLHKENEALDNNNLLNLNLEAFVTNFSTARLLYVDSFDRTLRVDTYAYIAPGE